MATHRLPILNSATAPDDSDNVFPASFATLATNDNWLRNIFVFLDTATRIGLHGGFVVPKNYVGTPKLIVVWTATATSGDVEWDFDYRAVGGDDTESLDQATAQESVNQNDTAPTAALRRLEVSITLSANFAIDDEVEYTLFRDGTDGGDTMAASSILFSLLFEYSDA